ncbi:hypothetical protein FQN54_002333 [Arachnomyces sp. PD_36]|nr:hypothetical protein FQN54_002333 [Arachnomyces sp. PD_36]
MDGSVSEYSRPKRQPLGDASNRINIRMPSVSRPRGDAPSNSSAYTQQEPFVKPPTSPIAEVENKRLSSVIDNESSSKRNSAISTTSTASGKPRRKTHVGPWQLGRTLGKGSTGRVRLAKHAVTGQSAAIKIVSKKSAAMVQSESIAAMDKNPRSSFVGTPGTHVMPSGIEREVVIMKLIEHPNVINLYDVWENRGELYLVLEHVGGGELFDYVSTHGALPEEEAVRLFRQIIAGLSYCHRFNICHRDLKPENILLDTNGNIKLADFGMAALQPAGHWLNTSCGSPHYASPEIIYGRRYRGDKADIWSCGIILFAMLTGFLPFDGGDLTRTLQLVKKGEYSIPPWLTTEAVDLIQRILQKRPEDRISMKAIWAHPLLKKYEILHHAMTPVGADPPGPPPPLSPDDCCPPMDNVLDIDMELLHSLQTLWHGVKQETLIQKLLSPEPNHERLFYNALIKFRDEQLENYQGPIEYSASDYHHISKPPPKPMARQTSTNRLHPNNRRRSQFSIATDGVGSRKSSRNGSYKEQKSSRTIESYDPYRSSRTPVSDPSVEYASVTVHRRGSGTAKRQVSSARHRVVSRIHTDEMSSSPPRSETSSRGIGHLKKISTVSLHSRSSIASSRRGYFPVRRSISYQKNVSFRHLRKRSGTSPCTPHQASQTQSQHSLGKGYSDQSTPQPTNRNIVLSPDRYSSPSLPTPPVRPRVVPGRVTNELNPKKPRVPSNYWKEEARKVSSELGQICEEAFNRSSVSPDRPSVNRRPDGIASRISQSPEEPRYGNPYQSPGVRPLPETPLESTSSYTIRELIETRRRLIEHSTKAHAEGLPAYLTEVIAHLDRLIKRDLFDTDRGRRAISDPMPKLHPVSDHLPPISEEQQNLAPVNEAFESLEPGRNHVDDSQRATSGSTKRSGSTFGSGDERSTIRIVPQTPAQTPSADGIKPLSIRKKSSALTTTSQPGGDSSPDILSSFINSTASDEDNKAITNPTIGIRRGVSGGLDTILEDPRSPKRSNTVLSGDHKKWSWFKHKSQCSEERSYSPVKDTQPTRPASALGLLTDKLGMRPNEDKPEKVVSKRASLLKLFGKKKLSRRLSHEVVTGGHEQEDTASVITNTAISEVSTVRQRPTEEQKRQKQDQFDKARPEGSRNWFARFFHVKPARRVIALNTPKNRGRKEVIKILREWKQYGLEGVRVDKLTTTIFGSVGEVNFLRLKPVQFSAEFFTVLEHGRHANLSLVHFKQERGAASSFHKVVDTLHMVLKQRGLAVQDPDRAKKMAKVLA